MSSYMSSTPYEAKPARLIVYERTGRWAMALRRELGDAGLRVWESRTLNDCRDMLAESPASFIILELSPLNVPETLGCIQTWQNEFPLFRFAVVADRNLAVYEWLMRETGAVHFLCSIRKISNLAETACRHLAQVPTPPQSLTERIWSNLPWPERAKTHR